MRATGRLTEAGEPFGRVHRLRGSRYPFRSPQEKKEGQKNQGVEGDQKQDEEGGDRESFDAVPCERTSHACIVKPLSPDVKNGAVVFS